MMQAVYDEITVVIDRKVAISQMKCPPLLSREEILWLGGVIFC